MCKGLLKKEMANVVMAFKILEDDERTPVGHKKLSGHLIFNVKMDFTQKARWVKDGHCTPDPKTSKYAGVVSQDSIRILPTYATLHGIDGMAADIWNAYLQAPTSKLQPQRNISLSVEKSFDLRMLESER